MEFMIKFGRIVAITIALTLGAFFLLKLYQLYLNVGVLHVLAYAFGGFCFICLLFWLFKIAGIGEDSGFHGN